MPMPNDIHMIDNAALSGYYVIISNIHATILLSLLFNLLNPIWQAIHSKRTRYRITIYIQNLPIGPYVEREIVQQRPLITLQNGKHPGSIPKP